MRIGVACYGSALLLPAALHAASPSLDVTTHYRLLGLYTLFAVLHSGGAALRSRAVPLIGERLYRIGFAATSLPSAVLCIAYFIAHRYDGLLIPTLQALRAQLPHFHTAVGALSGLSFLFLYPATFRLLEVAAIQRPTLRLYETGIVRLTRHPQLWGQVLWCVAHGAWIGSSMALCIGGALIGHHFVAAWHGDRRLRERYGAAAWRAYADRTSLWPFRSVWQRRQSLRAALREMRRPAYLGVAVFVALTYAAHPSVQHWAGTVIRGW